MCSLVVNLRMQNLFFFFPKESHSFIVSRSYLIIFVLSYIIASCNSNPLMNKKVLCIKDKVGRDCQGSHKTLSL